MLISLSFVIHPLLAQLSKYLSDHFCRRPRLPTPGPRSVQFLTLLCLYISAFSLRRSLLPSLQSLYWSPGHFLPAFHSVSFLVVSLTHVVNTCLSVVSSTPWLSPASSVCLSLSLLESPSF